MLSVVLGCGPRVVTFAPDPSIPESSPAADTVRRPEVDAATWLGDDAVMVVFATTVAPTSVTADAFVVNTAKGARLVPEHATLAPANELDEHRTVTISGLRVPEGDSIADVLVVAGLHDIYGQSMRGLSAPVGGRDEPLRPVRIVRVHATASRCHGQSIGLRSYWNRPVLGVDPEDLVGIGVGLADGSMTTPVRFDDHEAGVHADNVVDFCLAAGARPVLVELDAGLFHDAQGRPNVAAAFDHL